MKKRKTDDTDPDPATHAGALGFEPAVAGEMQLRVSDNRGPHYVCKMRTNNGVNSIVRALENLPAGVYRVSLQHNLTLETRRLVKVTE